MCNMGLMWNFSQYSIYYLICAVYFLINQINLHDTFLWLIMHVLPPINCILMWHVCFKLLFKITILCLRIRIHFFVSAPACSRGPGEFFFMTYIIYIHKNKILAYMNIPPLFTNFQVELLELLNSCCAL